MDTSYCQEIDAQFGRGARGASKQGKEKVNVVERESENKKKGKGTQRKGEEYPRL